MLLSAAVSVPIVTTLAVGFVLGLRHALDADHVAAVAALNGPREGLTRALGNGMSWGFGHAATLGLAGGAAIALRSAFPERLAQAFELLAALMLILLGSVALRGAMRDRLHVHAHRHDDLAHAHLHFHVARRHVHDRAVPHRHPHLPGLALRPFLVGSVHGLAGSGALALLVLATLPTATAGLVYLVIFGAGTTIGMMAMSLVLGAPLVLAQQRASFLALGLRAAAGLGSLLVGIDLAFRTARDAGLLG